MEKLLKAASSLQINRVLHKNSCLHCFKLLSSSRGSNKFFGRPNYLYHPANSLLAERDRNVKGNGIQLREVRQWIKLEQKIFSFAEKLVTLGYLDRKLLDGFIQRFSLSPSSHDKDQKRSNEEKGEGRKKPDDDISGAVVLLSFWLTLLFMLSLISRGDDPGLHAFREISWTAFIGNLLQKGEVQEIHIDKAGRMPVIVKVYPGAKVNGYTAPNNRFRLSVPEVGKLEDRIREEEKKMGIAPSDGVLFTYENTAKSLSQLMFILLGIISLTLWIRFSNRKRAMDRKKMKKDGGDSAPIDDLFGGMTKPRFVRGDNLYKTDKALYFKDVAGLKEAKIEVMEFVDYLRNPTKFRKLGAKIPHGALLLGPPGCGKTLLAKALATEAKVPFFATAGSEFVEMIGGLGASRVRKLFKQARAQSPCIIYIDEIDAVGKKRSGMGGKSGGFENTEEEQTLVQLLAEMDGFGTEENIIILGSTNRADMLDQALLRPGRFDRHIMIDLPSKEERLELLELYMGKLALGFSISSFAPRLAQLTPGLSGADIQNICNMAAIHAATNKREAVLKSDFDYACERVMSGSAKKTSVLTPFERKVISYYQAGIVVVSWMLKSTEALLKVSVIPRTNSELGFSQFLSDDSHLRSREWIFDQMCVWLAGSVTEAVIFNHASTAAESDLKKVRQMAHDMIVKYGMSDQVGQLSFKDADDDEFLRKPYSKTLSSLIDEEIRATVARANLAAKEILEKNRDKLDKVAKALQEKETLTYEDIAGLIGHPPHGNKKSATQSELLGKAMLF